MASTEMNLKIPEEVIQAHIRNAVAETLGKNSDALVKAVVDAAVNQKRNSYDRTTIFEDQINAQIRDLAKQVFAEWLEERKELVRASIIARLQKNPKKFVTKLVDGLVEQMSDGWFVKVNLGWSDER